MFISREAVYIFTGTRNKLTGAGVARRGRRGRVGKRKADKVARGWGLGEWGIVGGKVVGN